MEFSDEEKRSKYEEQLERNIARNKLWKERNLGWIKEYTKKYYGENCEARKEYSRKYREENSKNPDWVISQKKYEKEQRRKYTLLVFPPFFAKLYEENKKDFQKIIYSDYALQRRYSFLTKLEFENDFPKCCDKCGKEKILQHHHRVYRYPMLREDIMFLCKSCHNIQDNLDKKLRSVM